VPLEGRETDGDVLAGRGRRGWGRRADTRVARGGDGQRRGDVLTLPA
jgi:hypothetical protein